MIFTQNDRANKNIICKIYNKQTVFQSQKLPISDTSQFSNYVKNNFVAEGYLMFKLDSIKVQKDTFYVYSDFGQKYESITLFYTQKDSLLKNSWKYVYKFNQNSFQKNAFKNLITDLLAYYADNGFPFVNLSFTNINFDKNTIAAQINIQPNDRILFDTLVFDTPTRTNARFLAQYLDITEGKEFSQKRFLEISEKITKSNMYTLVQTPYVVFKYNKAYVHLSIKEKKSGELNAMLGLSQEVKLPNKNILIGEFSYKNRNFLGKGWYCNLGWKRYQTLSQNMFITGELPYVFNSKIGVGASFKLLKQDTTFININRGIQVSILNIQNTKYGFTFEQLNSNVNKSSSILNYNTTSSSLYGLYAEFNNLSKIPFTVQKGFKIYINAKYGNKKINNSDTLPKTSDQIMWSAYLEKRTHVTNKIEFRTSTSFNGLKNAKNIILNNEMYRIGGGETVRGFAENQFFTSMYFLHKIESVFVLNSESAVSIFSDISNMNTSQKSNSYNTVYGFGLGISVKTALGILQVNYALGKSKEISPSLSNSKIHIMLQSDW